MNQDRFAGICGQFKGALEERWGRLTGNPLAIASGMRNRLAGRRQERYGVSAEHTARELAEFHERNRNWRLLNR